MKQRVKYTKELLEPIVKDVTSLSEVLRQLGRSVHGGAVAHLKKRIIEFNIDFSHFNRSTKGYKFDYKPRKKKYSIEEFKDKFLKKDTRIISDRLKINLLDKNILENRCSICNNNGEWQGEKLTLQIDHINGVRNDNRLENLRILCPNCHSQTKTYAGNNNKEN